MDDKEQKQNNEGSDIQEIPDQEVEIVDDEESGDSGVHKIKKLLREIELCRKEKDEYLSGWQRAKADLINYKKDEMKRFEDIIKFVAQGVIEEVMPVIDSFDLALKHEMPKNVETGIIMIRSQLEDLLQKHGISRIKVKSGDVFDPLMHESVMEVEAEGEPGTIAQELQRGYTINEKVIRPSRVTIVKKK